MLSRLAALSFCSLFLAAAYGTSQGAGVPPAPRTARLVCPAEAPAIPPVPGGSEAQFSVVIHNAGAVDLRILSVDTNCGCTVASYKPVIAPGATGIIRATVQTQPYWRTFAKELTVHTNDPGHPAARIKLSATVIPSVVVSPAEDIAVHYRDPGPIVRSYSIQFRAGLHPNPRMSAATYGPVSVTVEESGKLPGEYIVTATLTPPASGGDTLGVIELDSGVPGLPPVGLQFQALDDVRVSASPRVISFGSVHDGGPPQSRTVTLYTRKSDFNIRAIITGDPHLTASYRRLPTAAPIFEIDIQYTGGWARGKHAGTIWIMTDLPVSPKVGVPFEAVAD